MVSTITHSAPPPSSLVTPVTMVGMPEVQALSRAIGAGVIASALHHMQAAIVVSTPLCLLTDSARLYDTHKIKNQKKGAERSRFSHHMLIAQPESNVKHKELVQNSHKKRDVINRTCCRYAIAAGVAGPTARVRQHAGAARTGKGFSHTGENLSKYMHNPFACFVWCVHLEAALVFLHFRFLSFFLFRWVAYSERILAPCGRLY